MILLSFWVDWESLWCRFGVALESLWGRFGSLWGRFGVALAYEGVVGVTLMSRLAYAGAFGGT